jgi:hypothetical protein
MQRRELADATLPREWQWGRACTIVNNEAASSRAACSIASPMLLKTMVKNSKPLMPEARIVEVKRAH